MRTLFFKDCAVSYDVTEPEVLAAAGYFRISRCNELPGCVAGQQFSTVKENCRCHIEDHSMSRKKSAAERGFVAAREIF